MMRKYWYELVGAMANYVDVPDTTMEIEGYFEDVSDDDAVLSLSKIVDILTMWEGGWKVTHLSAEEPRCGWNRVTGSPFESMNDALKRIHKERGWDFKDDEFNYDANQSPPTPSTQPTDGAGV